MRKRRALFAIQRKSWDRLDFFPLDFFVWEQSYGNELRKSCTTMMVIRSSKGWLNFVGKWRKRDCHLWQYRTTTVRGNSKSGCGRRSIRSRSCSPKSDWSKIKSNGVSPLVGSCFKNLALSSRTSCRFRSPSASTSFTWYFISPSWFWSKVPLPDKEPLWSNAVLSWWLKWDGRCLWRNLQVKDSREKVFKNLHLTASGRWSNELIIKPKTSPEIDREFLVSSFRNSSKRSIISVVAWKPHKKSMNSRSMSFNKISKPSKPNWTAIPPPKGSPKRKRVFSSPHCQNKTNGSQLNSKK